MAARASIWTRARSWLFWAHLIAGVTAAAAIFTMSVTGALLALQPQILEWVEADQRRNDTAAGTARLAPGDILMAATVGLASLEGVSLSQTSDPRDNATVTIGRGRVLFVNPYTGRIEGAGATRWRQAFQWLTEFHRWFALQGESRATARAITGWSTVAFALLAVTGAVLWIPRTWSAALVARGLTPGWPSTAAARHFNWHTVFGFWSMPVLLVLALSGVVIAFPWATRTLYTLAGTPAPQQAGPRADGERQRQGRAGADAAAPADFRQVDRAWTVATQQLPTWGTITMRIQERTNGPLSFTITDATHWNRFARSQLIVSGRTGAVVRWEPYAATSRGQRWRLWARFAHTGELGGLAGQVVAGLASAAGALLVYTGLSLALRRLARTRKTARATAKAA